MGNLAAFKRRVGFPVAADQGLDYIPADCAAFRLSGHFLQGSAQVVGTGPVGTGADEGIEYIHYRHDLHKEIVQPDPPWITKPVQSLVMVAGGDGGQMVR